MNRRLMLLLILSARPALAESTPAPTEKPGIDQRIAALAQARDPFWPPGFKPGGETRAPAEEPTDDLGLLAIREGAKLNVQGRIKVGNKYLLMLKGRAVGQGDIIDVTGKNGKTFKMKIVSISQENIQLEPVGH